MFTLIALIAISMSIGAAVSANLTAYGSFSNGMAIPLEGGGSGIVGLSTTRYFSEGHVNVDLTRFSGEKDSQCGSNSFSIQGNTNTFIGTNGHVDWVQFTVQQNLGCSNYRLGTYICVWEIDLTKGDYNTYTGCDAVTGPEGWYTQTVSLNNMQATIYGSAHDGELTIRFLVGGKSWVKSMPDSFVLAKLWTQFSGTILGLGNGSTAKFTSPTGESTAVYVTGPWLTSPSAGVSISVFRDFGTAEMNNLDLQTVSAMNCLNGPIGQFWCGVSTTSTYLTSL